MNKKEQYIQALAFALQQAGKGNAYIRVCVNYAERLLENRLPVIFDTRHLASLLGLDINYFTSMLFSLNNHYREHSIPKKSGGNRQLYAVCYTQIHSEMDIRQYSM